MATKRKISKRESGVPGGGAGRKDRVGLCPLGQPKKAVGPEPQIESWLPHVQRIPFGLLIVSEIDRS